MNSIQAVLFDLDGLMVDSEPISMSAWQAVLARRGMALDQATFDTTLGLSMNETARVFAGRFDLREDLVALVAEKTAEQIEQVDGKVSAMPGLLPLIDALDEYGLKQAVASSGMRRYVMAVLAAIGLASRFAAIVTGDDVAKAKPAPDIFLRAAERLDVAPARCLVLEDAPAGVAAAKAAGMRCVAVPNDFTRRLDLSAAAVVLPSLSAVRDSLTQLIA
jgi:HAD superfamily hydrolase (TIGR01509 family)